MQEQSRSSNCNDWNLVNNWQPLLSFYCSASSFISKEFFINHKLLFRSWNIKGLNMFITHVKETPDVGHMLDTKGKDKLAVALANAKSELGARPVIEHKVVVFSTPEDELE